MPQIAWWTSSPLLKSQTGFKGGRGGVVDDWDEDELILIGEIPATVRHIKVHLSGERCEPQGGNTIE